MTNHSGETCLKHIPDIEWEKEFEKIFGNNLGIDEPFNNLYVRLHVKPAIKSFISNLCSSHTTYWKERVRKEVEGIKEKYSRRELQQSGYAQACDDILQALDNLK